MTLKGGGGGEEVRVAVNMNFDRYAFLTSSLFIYTGRTREYHEHLIIILKSRKKERTRAKVLFLIKQQVYPAKYD